MNQWQIMIVDLRKAKLTQAQIAVEIGCSQNYVSDLERGICGKRLSYEFGENLKALWEKHCETQRQTTS